MNLFLNPAESELNSLIENVPPGKKITNLVVDFDGEVLIDPQIEWPQLNLNQFKLCIPINEQQSALLMPGSGRLNNLYNSLLRAWNY